MELTPIPQRLVSLLLDEAGTNKLFEQILIQSISAKGK
jgi:hypothetical protein